MPIVARLPPTLVVGHHENHVRIFGMDERGREEKGEKEISIHAPSMSDDSGPRKLDAVRFAGNVSKTKWLPCWPLVFQF